MSWRDDWETTGYVRTLSPDHANRLRVRFRVENGKVARFSVQYETEIDDRFRAVVRYDSAHDYAHRDILDWDGHEIGKDWIAGPNQYSQVLTNAIADLAANWQTYRREFLRRRP
jgi:hypothetical protein